MAEDQQQKTSGGGNTPKPKASNQRNPTTKEQSRAQSRSVTTKAPGGRGGNAPRPKAGGAGGGRGPGSGRGGGGGGGRPQPKRISNAMLTWGIVGLVVVIILVIVLVKVTGGSGSPTTYTPTTPAPASVVRDVTTIPASVYDSVGVDIPSSASPVKPIVISGQPSLKLGGKAPSMVYYGAEWCPYCAAERWSMTAALSRFGTWSGLKTTASSHTDTYPATHTFSFDGASLSSSALNFVPIETCTNVPESSNTSCNGYKSLQAPTKEEMAAIEKYSSSQFVPGATAGQISFPFIDIDNRVLITGASYTPAILANLTWQQIASQLHDPSSLVTKAIVGSANYISAGVCAATNQQPANVCTSPGVQAATKALKLS